MTEGRQARGMAEVPPSVGIFWFVLEGGRAVPLCNAVPVAEGEDYGEFRNHGAHYEFWEGLRPLGADGLRRRGVPSAPAWSEYEEWPRGRVVHHVPTGRFVLYADAKLRREPYLGVLIAMFGLSESEVEVRGDPHYVSPRAIR